MCSRCDELAILIEQTHDGKSWVETTFPNGTPKLMERDPEGNPGQRDPAQISEDIKKAREALEKGPEAIAAYLLGEET